MRMLLLQSDWRSLMRMKFRLWLRTSNVITFKIYVMSKAKMEEQMNVCMHAECASAELSRKGAK